MTSDGLNKDIIKTNTKYKVLKSNEHFTYILQYQLQLPGWRSELRTDRSDEYGRGTVAPVATLQLKKLRQR